MPCNVLLTEIFNEIDSKTVDGLFEKEDSSKKVLMLNLYNEIFTLYIQDMGREEMYNVLLKISELVLTEYEELKTPIVIDEIYPILTSVYPEIKMELDEFRDIDSFDEIRWAAEKFIEEHMKTNEEQSRKKTAV